MSHPCLVTLDRSSAPRALFSGERLTEVSLPAGARVLYPKVPGRELGDVPRAIQRAVEEPLECAPLASRLRPGLRVTVAVDALSGSWLAPHGVDPRAEMLGTLLKLLRGHGVSDVVVVLATGLARRPAAREMESMLGDASAYHLAADGVLCHDPENPRQMAAIGETEFGSPVLVNRRVAESDLVITCSLSASPADGGFTPLALGLTGYQTWSEIYDPALMRRAQGYAGGKSGLSVAIERIGRQVAERVDVFHIQAALSNRHFSDRYAFLAKNEDDLTSRETLFLKGLVSATRRLPDVARRALWRDVCQGPGVLRVHGGTPAAVAAAAEQVHLEELVVPVSEPADVLVCGVPFFGPANRGTFLNPLLVQLAVQGFVFNRHTGAPVVRKGGTVILTHPCTDRFDHTQHAAYPRFFHELLDVTRDGCHLQQRFQQDASRDPALIEMFRRGHAYHPAHPFFAWYHGEAARQHLGRVIVVGADNEYVPKQLGYETAVSMAEALYRAGVAATDTNRILCVKTPPQVIAALPNAQLGGTQ